MKRVLTAITFAIVAATAVPAAAFSIITDFPHLTYPSDTPIVSQDCIRPTTLTSDACIPVAE